MLTSSKSWLAAILSRWSSANILRASSSSMSSSSFSRSSSSRVGPPKCFFIMIMSKLLRYSRTKAVSAIAYLRAWAGQACLWFLQGLYQPWFLGLRHTGLKLHGRLCSMGWVMEIVRGCVLFQSLSSCLRLCQSLRTFF